MASRPQRIHPASALEGAAAAAAAAGREPQLAFGAARSSGGAAGPRPPAFPPSPKPKAEHDAGAPMAATVNLPRPPNFPPASRSAGQTWPRPDAKDALRHASAAAMADFAPPPPPMIRVGTDVSATTPKAREPTVAQVIGASSAGGEASSRGGLLSKQATGRVSRTAVSAAEAAFQRVDVDGKGWASRLEILGAVATDQQVADFVVPDTSLDDPQNNELKLMQAEQAFLSAGGGKNKLRFGDFIKHLHSKGMIRHVWDTLDADGGIVSEADFVGAVAQDARLIAFLLPEMHRRGTDKASMRDAVEALFKRIATQIDGIRYDDFEHYVRKGAEAHAVFTRMDSESAGTISRLEFMGAMATDPVVASCMLPGFCGDLMPDAKLVEARKAVFSIPGQGERITLEAFASLSRCEALATASAGGVLELLADEGPLALPAAAAGQEGQEVALADAGEGGEPAEAEEMLALEGGQLPRRDWADPWKWSEVEWLKSKFKAPEHPLDAEPLKTADQEVRVAIWGTDVVGPKKKINYEDEYDNFPYFCCVVSAIQLLFYVGAAGNQVSWGGPVGKPEQMYMMVYDSNCEDVRNQVWRLWTYQWIHVSMAHVVGDCFGNLVVGGLLEAVHGTKQIGILYTCGVITGGLTMGTVQPHRPVIGSSGGVYTMIGARIANLVINKDSMPNTFWFRVTIISVYLIYDTLNFFVSYSASTSYSAHAGGWLCGLLYGGYWLENLDEKPFEQKFIKWCKRIFVVYVLFCLIWYLTQASGSPQALFDSSGYCAYST